MKPGYVRRFSKTERTVHWVNALGFFFLLATGLILYVPRLSIAVGRRQFIHYPPGVVGAAIVDGDDVAIRIILRQGRVDAIADAFPLVFGRDQNGRRRP